MYENIGGKIKGLATTLFVIMAILYGIIGIVMMATNGDVGIVVGLLVIVAGFFFSWISSWLLFGFGELIDKTCDIEKNTRQSCQPAGNYYQHTYNQEPERTAEYVPLEKEPKESTHEMSERIARLKALRDKGIITEEEYLKAISMGE